MKVAVTGHRPDRIKGREGEIKEWIAEKLQEMRKNGGGVRLITGMAQGVDQIAALAALRENVPVHCYFAYKHKLQGTEEMIADKAAEVKFLENRYLGGCFIRRDRRMVDDCDLLLVVWDGEENGGTYYTYQYALKKGVPVLVFDWGTGKEEV